MNYLKLSGLILSIALCCTRLHAQAHVAVNEPDTKRQELFSSFPKQIPVAIADLERFLSKDNDEGKEVALKLADRKLPELSGKIVSSAIKYQNTVRSVVVRLSDFNGATLTLSSSTADGTTSYAGRIISFQHADLFELKRTGDQYYLIKKNFYELVSE